MRQFVLLARHGQSQANAGLQMTSDGLFYSLCGSDEDVPQTLLGQRQSAAVARQVVRMFPRHRKLSHIYHTRFKRVRQMLDPLDRHLTYKVKRSCDDRLNKRSYGAFWNLTHLGVETLHPDEWQRYSHEGDLRYRAPAGGENYYDLFARVDDFIDTTLAKSRGHTLIFTHSVVLLAFQRRLEGLDDTKLLRQYEEQTLPNGHLLIYYRDSVIDAWRPCDVSTLAA